MSTKLDSINPRYDYNPNVAPSEGLGIAVFDREHGILRLTSIASTEKVGEGDFLLTVRAKSVNDLDEVAEEEEEPTPPPVEEEDPPVEEPEEGGEEPEEEEPPVEEEPDGEDTQPGGDPDPAPTPTPVPTGWPTGGVSVTPATLMAAIARREPVIMLEDGDYGSLSLGSRGAPVKIYPRNKGGSVIRSVWGSGASNITFYGVKLVNAKLNQSDGWLWRTLSNCDAVNLIDSEVLGWADVGAGSPYHWSKSDWIARETTGIFNQGTNCIMRGCDIRGVRFGAVASGAGCIIEDCVVRGFSEDAYRAMGGANIICRNNRGYDYFDLGFGRHPDLLQLWSIGADGRAGSGVMEAPVIEGNLLYDWIGSASHTLRGKAQGASGFDGMFNRASIRNNTIVASLYHGMAWTGMTNSVVEGNVILDEAGLTTPGFPWLQIWDHKNGTPSTGNTMRNNVAEQVVNDGVDQIGKDGNRKPDYSKTDFAALKARVAA